MPGSVPSCAPLFAMPPPAPVSRNTRPVTIRVDCARPKSWFGTFAPVRLTNHTPVVGAMNVHPLGAAGVAAPPAVVFSTTQ